MSQLDLLKPWRFELKPSRGRGLHTGHTAVPGIVGGLSWMVVWAGMSSFNKSILVVHTKGLVMPWKVVKKRSFPLHTLFLVALPMLATPMETNRSCPLAQGAVRDYLGTYFYLTSFIPAWKQALITSRFENTLTDKCRRIQGESVGGDVLLRTAQSIYLCLFAEWKDLQD